MVWCETDLSWWKVYGYVFIGVEKDSMQSKSISIQYRIIYQKRYYDYIGNLIIPHQGIFLFWALLKGDLGNHQVMFLWSS